MNISIILMLVTGFAVKSCDRSPEGQESSLYEEWNRDNRPENMGVSADQDFRDMPNSARAVLSSIKFKLNR